MTGAAGRRSGRRLPSWWVVALVVAPLALILWLRTGDRTGDQGMTNVATGLLTLLALAILLVWFAACRGYAPRTRLAVLGGLVLSVLLLLGLFRLEGWSGSMVPRFVPRWAGPAEWGSGDESVAPGAAPDLTVTGPMDFPGFLGPGRDLVVEGVALARDWTATPPRELWRRPVGAGWSGFAIVNGVAVTQEERDGRQVVAAYRAATGEPLWSHSWEGGFDHPLGGPGPRATPLIDRGRVFALGPGGRLVALDGGTGEPLWERRLLEEYGVTPEAEAATVSYGRSNSPLAVGELVIVPAGGRAGGRLANLAAYHRDTGERIWEGSERQIGYSSPAAATLAGVPQVLIVNEASVTGHDPATGEELWSHPWPGRSSADASNSQAVPLPPDRVLVSKGYGVGAAVLRLAPAGGALAVEVLWHEGRLLRTKHTNVVVRDGYAYGLSDGILECVDLAAGERRWKRGRYGHGQILAAGDLLLVLSEEGELFLIGLSPEHPDQVLGSLEALDGLTWNNLALAGDLLLVRNGREAVAYRLPTPR